MIHDFKTMPHAVRCQGLHGLSRVAELAWYVVKAPSIPAYCYISCNPYVVDLCTISSSEDFLGKTDHLESLIRQVPLTPSICRSLKQVLGHTTYVIYCTESLCCMHVF